MKHTPSSQGNKGIRINRGIVESVDLYEIKDSELDLLESGAPASIQLNFAIFLFSIAFASIAALCTANFKWAIAKQAFLFISIVGILGGSYLLLMWWKTRTSVKGTVCTIRRRIERCVSTVERAQAPAHVQGGSDGLEPKG